MSFLSDYLENLEMFGIKPGLAVTQELLALAGHPECGLKFLHLAGSNGKGSTGAMLEKALRQVGFRTGFYSSPHLLDVTERFRLDGQAADADELDDLARKLAVLAKQVAQKLGVTPTYFEFTTVLALQFFQKHHCDFVIWETGMGGRLDATNVVTPEASIITNIALDHQKYLGDTLAKIAGEKAGIIKPHCPVFCGQIVPEALSVIATKAAKAQAELTVLAHLPRLQNYLDTPTGRSQQVTTGYGQVTLSLAGAMQRYNLGIVLMVLDYLSKKYRFSFQTAVAGLAEVKWPGRCQKLPNGMWLDGGHNPDGARAIAQAMRELYPNGKFTIIFANFCDKDTAGTLKELAHLANRFIFTSLAYSHRQSYSGVDLAGLLSKVSPVEAIAAKSVPDALALARPVVAAGQNVLICGSLYLVGEVLATENLKNTALNL